MKAVALENAKFGVRANCVCPGPIHTAWLENGESPIPGKQLKEIEANTPMGRMGTPEEIANVYAFLASDEASYVTAALWLVDGGITPGKGGGDKVPKSLRKEPADELPLRHTLDGLKNKEVRQLA
jgi:NAD(P)-dependent dehydrogenase (short-subunit alcohol dehydrogenase family)